MELRTVARVFSPFGSKFGVPRQSGLVPELRSRLVFEKEYRSRECLRGIEGFSHLWLLWGFSENADRGWSPTVRPPRLGGNERVGVFASRSPFRPNPLGLSCVRLLAVEWERPEGPCLLLGGADLTDGTPVYDIKPYIVYADSVPEATGGFTAGERPPTLPVRCPEELRSRLMPETWAALEGILACDPRPHYHRDPTREYGFPFAGREVRFRVTAEGVEVLAISELKKGEEP